MPTEKLSSIWTVVECDILCDNDQWFNEKPQALLSCSDVPFEAA